MSAWNKVYVLEGEPFYIQYNIKFIQEDLGNPEIIKYSNNASADNVKSALMAYPFFNIPDLIVLAEPNAELLKVCLELVESNFSASGLIITCENNTFDSRLSFISKANKNKRISYFNPIQGSDIRKYIKDWSTETGVKLSSDCLSWFETNGPTMISKMKSPNGKKDIIVHDLLTLEKFLNKLETLYKSCNQVISVDDLNNYSNFKRESDIWAFIENILSDKMNDIYMYFNKYPISLSNHSILWLIASQFEFLIQIKSLLSFTKNLNEITDRLTLKNLLGYYLNDNMEEVKDFKAKANINPYRLQMAINTCNNISIENLTNKYQATISAIRDLRSGLDSDLVALKLVLAYSNKNNYLDPFLDV